MLNPTGSKPSAANVSSSLSNRSASLVTTITVSPLPTGIAGGAVVGIDMGVSVMGSQTSKRLPWPSELSTLSAPP